MTVQPGYYEHITSIQAFCRLQRQAVAVMYLLKRDSSPLDPNSAFVEMEPIATKMVTYQQELYRLMTTYYTRADTGHHVV
jgi:hypothetical protein